MKKIHHDPSDQQSIKWKWVLKNRSNELSLKSDELLSSYIAVDRFLKHTLLLDRFWKRAFLFDRFFYGGIDRHVLSGKLIKTSH